ncbi:hypothetical protein N658DRAFT_517629 [Parathielavia hyrcaniae]|uniref:Uncharacterized protein n=1 Tax=Parathielavia hyrcaniae TaxID=113614 RepID=A0AAN6SZZ9_9PEZI|nr:hypothetical protein N658DRAFT_517629 [Parathielavia hyrcaniae]
MCLTKVYYNTYSDGAQDITEKNYPCRDGRNCSRPDVRKYERKFPFSKLGDAQPESHRSLSERKPTPYFDGHTPRGSKSPSPSGRRDSGVYMSGAMPSNHYDYRDPYGSYDAYGYHSSSRQDRHERGREPRLKRSSTTPHIVYLDRERDRDRDTKSSRSRSHSSSRDYSRDVPLGLVPLADEYGSRRHSSSSRSRSRDAANNDPSDMYYSHRRRRRTDDPAHGYTVVDDQNERRRQRREQRRMSTSSYPDPSSSASASRAYDAAGAAGAAAYVPRRASTVVHHSDGSVSTGSGGKTTKHLRWEDQVRAKRERQNAEIASRPAVSLSSASLYPGEVKGILKHSSSVAGKGKGREVGDDDGIADLRRAVERMELPRGRDREPRRGDEWAARGGGGGGGGGVGGGGGYGEDVYGEGRRKRSKVYADDRYRY